MAVMGRFLGAWVGRFVTLLLLLQLCMGDDIVHNDDQEPKQPGCNNSYVLVKIQNWINVLDPIHACNESVKMVPKHAALVWRGDCTFTTKARIAQAAGAVSLVIVNDKEELYKMVCSKNETYTDIRYRQ
ncbi:unnamed protein product [Sphagnum jensenii]|uniref:PA domain-containing protein n=1 Tax=Sphagnum jensenii TaxID=128206 RepID=A0ABP1C0C2_9BRYO